MARRSTPPPKTPEAAAAPKEESKTSTTDRLNEIGMEYMNDPAKSLAEVEHIIATEPTNEFAHRLATLIACDLNYKQQLHGGTPAEIAASEKKARAYGDTLTPHDRWLVSVRMSAVVAHRLVGDIDKHGDGKIEHFDAQKP